MQLSSLIAANYFQIQPEKHTKYVSEHKKLEATGASSLEQKEREKKEKKYSKENIARKKAKFRNEGNGDKMLKNEELQEDKTRKERYSHPFNFLSV